MITNKALIFSAKFNPGHVSHIEAFVELFKELNYIPELLLDDKYLDFIEQDEVDCVVNKISNFDFKTYDVVLIINQSPSDIKYMKKLIKYNKDLKIIFSCHEPWGGYKNCFKSFFSNEISFKAMCISIARYILCRKLLKKTHCVVLFSDAGKKKYEKKLVKFCDNYIVTKLPFKKEKLKENVEKEKYFSFIGAASVIHAFDEYIDTIVTISKIDDSIKFIIATKDIISKKNIDKIQHLINEGKVIIHQGTPMSTSEINFYYSKSSSLWLLYKKSVQSGVLCKSFMFGTPVIASNIGSFNEYISNNKNGFVLDDYNSNIICEKINTIWENQKSFSSNCEESFNTLFNYVAIKDDFYKILG